MIERIAIPSWDTPPTPLETWTAGLAQSGHTPHIARDGGNAAWIDLAPLRLRGYAIFEAGRVEAINFECHDRDPSAALALLESVASAIGWEIHDETDDDDD